MKFTKLLALVMVCLISMILLGSTSVLAVTWQVENNVHNYTATTYNDFENFIGGNFTFPALYSNVFPSNTIITFPTYKELRWFGANVPFCSRVTTGFQVNSDAVQHLYVPKWSLNGNPMAPSPALDHKFTFVPPNMCDVTLSNTALDGSPETIGTVRVGPSNTVYNFPQLNVPFLDPIIPWQVTQNNVPLPLGGSVTYRIILPAGTRSVIYWAKVWFNNNPNNPVEYVGQWAVVIPPTPTPTLIIPTPTITPTITPVTPTPTPVTPTPTPTNTPTITPVTPTPTITISAPPVTPTPTATPSYDTWQNEHLHNGTGQVANDIEKWIEGDILVSNWYSDHFTAFDYIYLSGENVTKLRWYNGTVAPCEYSYACFRTRQRTVRHRYLPRWSFDAKATFVAGAALSTDFEINQSSALMTIANTPVDGGPATVGIIQVGTSDVAFTLDKLTWDNLNSIPWSVSMSDIRLNLGESRALPLIPISSPTTVLVYRATIWLDSDPSMIVEYTGQLTPADSASVPTPIP